MRAILIALVLVNVVWAIGAGVLRDEPRSGRVAAPTRTVGPGLALLSELPPGSISAAEPASAAAAQPIPAEVADRIPADRPPDEVASEQQGPDEVKDPAPAAAVAPTAAEAVDPTTEEPSGVTDSEPDAPDLETAVASVDPPEVSTDKPQKCLAMGPFDKLARVEALRDEVLAAGGSAEIVSEEILGRPDYLVFIYTASRGEARRIREELQARSIDSYIIAGGDLQNDLSVGVFSQEPLARRQYDRVTALEYPAAVRELPRQQTIYHLMADRPVSDPAVPGRAACHEIAAAGTF